MRTQNRARWVAAVFLAGSATLAGCNLKDQLLSPQNPGTVDETAVGTPAAALALRAGAIGRIRNVVNGGDDAHLPNSYISVIDTMSGKVVWEINVDCPDVEAMALERSQGRGCS